MVYARGVCWEPCVEGSDDVRENSVAAIDTFTETYRSLKRSRMGRENMPRSVVKHAERTIKQLLRTPVVQVEPTVAVAMLARLERQFMENHGPSGDIAEC